MINDAKLCGSYIANKHFFKPLGLLNLRPGAVRLDGRYPHQRSELIMSTGVTLQSSSDVSAADIGISGIGHVPVGATIVVHLLNDHRLEGRIIWTKHGHTGIALLQPLDGSALDPISSYSEETAYE